MCTLIFLHRFLQGFPIVTMHNRYAHIGSEEEPPTVLRGKLRVYCPLDSHSRGTWVGFNEKGLFAAVTDQHTNSESKSHRSRGLLLLDVLTSFSRASEALTYLNRELAKGYRRGNFVLADSNEAYHILHDEKEEVSALKPGVHVFTNLTMRDWVKLDDVPPDVVKHMEARRNRAVELTSKLAPKDVNQIMEQLKSIASDHGGERGRGSICYHDARDWYMSSSIVMAVAAYLVDSRVAYARGNPCENQFIDYSYRLFGGGQTVEVSEKTEKLADRRVALCLTGSVACIEAPKIARELRRNGAEVTCYMTQAAIDCGVSPYVMEWATGKPVVLKLTGMTEHLPQYDLVVLHPATLNSINKIAQGVADNAVTTLCASTEPSKLLIAPAMNLKLYENQILQKNMETLKKLGATFIEPRINEGTAKVATVDTTVDHAIRCLSSGPLKDRGILILTGPTRYDLDPVRYISNKSSGKLGYCLAKEAFHRGCRVKVIYGPGSVTFPSHIPVLKVYTVEDMLAATFKELNKGTFDVAIFSAAILDFKPTAYVGEKVKSGSIWGIDFKPTPKIIDEVSKRNPELSIVGFKLEYKVTREELLERAREELLRTGASLVVANDLSEIRGDHHKASLIDPDGNVKDFEGTKTELAQVVFDKIEERLIRSNA